MENTIKQHTADYAFELLCTAFPPIAAIKNTKDYFANLSNTILLDKIKCFIQNQDSDFDEWLKISCDFQNDSTNYTKTIKMLIYTLNSINDEMKNHVYSNLFRSYKLNRISKGCLLRLSSILPIIFYDDLLFLKNNVRSILSSQTMNQLNALSVQNLFNHGLLRLTKEAAGWGGDPLIKEYACSPYGLEMVRCGVDFDNYNRYKGLHDDFI